jgi:hypothetical protein
VSRTPEFELVLLAIAACWLACAYKLPALIRHPRERSLQAYCAMLFLIGLAGAVLVPPGRGSLDRALGLPNFAQLLGNSLGIASAYCGLVFLASLNGTLAQARRRERAFAATAALTVIVLLALFLFNPTPDETDDFWLEYGRVPGLVAYRLIFLGYSSYVLVNVIRLTVRYASISTRASMRLGMRSVAAGALAGQTWALIEAARVLVPAPDLLPPGALLTAIAVSLMAVTVILIAVGSTLPSWGPRVGADAALAWLADYRSLRRLYPLWKGAWSSAPEVVIVPPRSRIVEALDVRDVRFRLYRRMVEIRDAMLFLQQAGEDAPPPAPAGSGRPDFAAEVKALERLAGTRSRWEA